MKRKEEIIAGLKAHGSSTPSQWRKNADWRTAERMGCSQQYVSRILKGTENLSIETISKIESALNLGILGPASPHVKP